MNRHACSRRARVPLAWALGLALAVALAAALTGLTAGEVASLAPASGFDGRDNVLLGALFAQGAIAAAVLARGRRPVRKRRQLASIALGLLSIASLLFGIRGLVFMLLLEVAAVVSFPRHRPF